VNIAFLDRDGVINEYPGDAKYVSNWQEFRFIEGVEFALRRLTKAGFKVFIISNQAGIARGIYSKDNLDLITDGMLKKLQAAGVKLDGVYYCIHRNEDNCSCRKPKIGSLERALKEHDIPKQMLKKSFFIGDSITDIQTGKNAGCRTILVFSGKEKAGNQDSWTVRPDFTAADLKEAVNFML